MLEHPRLKWMNIVNCLKVSQLVGGSFKSDVGEYFLFKPGNEVMDTMFLGALDDYRHSDFLDLLSTSEVDQSHIIDRLIAEGRLKKNTPEAKQLRRLLGGSSVSLDLSSKIENLPRQTEVSSNNTRPFAWLYWVLGLFFLGGLGMLVWSNRKGLSAS